MLFLHNILNGIWMMDQDSSMNYLPLIVNYVKGEPSSIRTAIPGTNEMNDRNSIEIATLENGIYAASGNSKRVSADSAPQGVIAIMDIRGAITKYDQECGPAGIKTKSDILRQCYASDNISAVVMVIDSGGGQEMAMRMMADTINQRNKPVGIYIEDCACSAAYAIASSADYICANSPMAHVGSIGTVGTILDLSKQLEQKGINLIEIYATASTDKNKPFADAINGKPEALRAQIDVHNENFLKMVETNRADKLTADRKVWGTGKVFFADQALELGLIDAIDTFENFLNYFNS